MQFLNAKEDLDEVEAGNLLRHPLVGLENSEEFSTRVEIHHKDEVVLGLKCPLHPCKEGVVYSSHHVPFVDHQLLLLVLPDEALADGLHCVELSS